MKKIVLTVLTVLLAGTLVWAGNDPNPADYTVNVHVSSSSLAHNMEELSVVVNGKNYNLESETTQAFRLLALGDYKAKLVQDEHKTTYDSYQVYEFLFPDKKTRKFVVVGQSE